MFSVQREDSYESFAECLELGEDQYNEVESKSAYLPYNVDWDMAEALHSSGAIVVITARDNGLLIGYFVSMVSGDLLTSSKQALELGIYLNPAYRNSSVFIKMLRKSEATLKAEGVYMNMLAFKKGHNEDLGERLGYEATEIVYQKVIGD